MTSSYFDIIIKEIICQKQNVHCQNNTITIAINGQRKMGTTTSSDIIHMVKVKISLFQAVEAHRVARG
jgi:hypothetical protein